jgi:DNA repair photolyase
MRTLNPDGVSLKGAKYIYAPAGQAGEYAPLASNPYRGCGHKCAYCYVPRILKMDRRDFDAGAWPRPHYLDGLRKDAADYQAAGITEQVMLSFTTDIYSSAIHGNVTRPALQIIVEHGMGICPLTKGGTRALKDIDLFRPERDAFASTLTSVDAEFSQKWERAAALPNDRMAALQAFHARGIFTWVSLEPTLDTDSSIEVVKATHEYVDLYKVGRVNYVLLTKTTDWKTYTLRMIELLQKLGKPHYIKRDLQGFLPAGYNNPLRIPQHH